MHTRTLGTQGLTVSALGYGAMGTAMAWGPTDDTASIAAIRKAHDLGVTHFDTAELYGWGAGEKLLGTALAPVRDEVTIATKFGFTRSYGANSQPDHIREVVDASLRHLGVDVIDVLYQHKNDPDVPIEDVAGAMKELIEAGKVKYIGLSNTTPENVRRAHAVHPVSVLQAEYSIFEHQAQAFLPTLEDLGIGLVAYSPLARGFLTGGVQPRSTYAADDFRQTVPWWDADNFDKNLEITRQLTELAKSKGLTLSQLALAWLLARKDYIVPIPGARSLDRVTENIAAADAVLTEDDLKRVHEIVPDGAFGNRFADSL